MAIPDAQFACPALAPIGWQSQAWQQLGEHLIRIGGIAADEGAHTDTEAPVAREGPAEAMVHQAEVKAGRVGFAERSIHLH